MVAMTCKQEQAVRSSLATQSNKGSGGQQCDLTVKSLKFCVMFHGCRLGLPDFANENTGCPVKFEFQINKELLFKILKYSLYETDFYKKMIHCLSGIQI